MDKRLFLVLAAVLPLIVLPLSVSLESDAAEPFDYGSQLDPESKSVYDVCVNPYNGANPMNRTWDNPTPLLPEVGEAALKTGAIAAFLDHPDYFWLWNVPSGVENAVIQEDGKIRFVLPEVDTVYRSEKVGCVKEMYDFADGMIISEKTSIYDAMKLIDRKLRDKSVLTDAEEEPLADTAYGAIVLGKASSLGFAAALKYCAEVKNVAGTVVIPGTLNSIEKSEPHFWNAVRDGEGWYVTDIALNKASDTDYYLMKAHNEYGLNTDYTLSASHQPGVDVYAESMYSLKTPEISFRAPSDPPEPTFSESYGSEIMLIAMVAVLCAIMIYAIRNA